MFAAKFSSHKRQGKHALHLLSILAVCTAAGAAQLKMLGGAQLSTATPAAGRASHWSTPPKKSPHEIQLKRRHFTPAPGVAASRHLQTRAWHGLIQFYTAPGETVLGKLRTQGVKVQLYVDTNVVAGAIPAGFKPSTVPEIRWMGPLAPGDKISTYFTNAAMVQFFPDATPVEIRAAIGAVGGTLLPQRSLPGHIVFLRLSPEQARQLAANDNVAWIGAAPAALAQGKSIHYCPGQTTKAGPVAPFSTRSATFSSGWDGPGQGSASLKFHFTNSTPDLSVAVQRADLTRALNKWSQVAAITWTQTATAGEENSVDMAFTTIDGPSNTLGITPAVFFSGSLQLVDADIDFDEAETWRSGSDIDLFTVALHEAGHALGLDHSDDPNAVMFASYSGVVSGLATDDINGIRSIYATVSTAPTATPVPTSTPLPTATPVPTATPLPTATPTAPPVPPAISISNTSITEGNSGTVNANFTVSLSKTSASTVTVNFATANNSAVAPGDFVAASGTLTFTAGQTSKTIAVAVNGDTTIESNETFFVNLSGATNAGISDSQGVGTIGNDDTASTFTIRGRVATSTGTGIPNVQLTRTGGPNVVTNPNGEYVFTVAPGTYTIAPLITPSLNGVTFSPTSRNLTVGASNLTNINFTAFFSITGRVSNSLGVVIPNIQIRRQAGTSTVTAITDANGNYRFGDVRSGSYAISPNITPAMTGLTFNPAAYNVTVNTANLTNINFTVFFSINGKVTNSSGVAMPNVLITRRQGTSATTVLTDANGNYRFGDVRSGSYSITPTLNGKTFNPASRSTTVGTQNLTNINFIGS